MPDAFVVAVPPVTDPPPEKTVNVTVTPDFAFPLASFTRTDGGVATAVPATAVWLSPPFFVTDAAAPAVDVAVNVTTGSVPVTALSTFSPTDGPSVHPTVATPDASVVAVAPDTDPPPLTTVNVTGAPAIGDPF
jgi:hypothetical protein